MPYYAPLSSTVHEKCNQCNQPAHHLWQSATGNVFPKCDEHMQQAQEKEDEFNELQPWNGQNEYGEYYNEDSY